MNQYDKAYAHGLSCTECWPDCPTEPTEHTVFDVLELEYYMPANILLSAMNNTTQHMIDFPSEYADFYYKIDFTSKEFSTANMLGGYVNLPFTSKWARYLLESEKPIGNDDSKMGLDMLLFCIFILLPAPFLFCIFILLPAPFLYYSIKI